MVWQLIVIQIVTVVAIVMFLRALLHKQFTAAMSRLKHLDEDNFKKQQGLDKRHKDMEGEHRLRLTNAEKEAQNIIEKAKVEAMEIKSKSLNSSKDESKRIISDVLKQKETILKEYKAEINDKVIYFSKELIKAVLDDEMMLVVKSEMIKRVLSELSKSDISVLSQREEDIHVLSDGDISKDDKSEIVRIMEKNNIKKERINFKADSSVIGGLIIRCGEHMLDGSISNRMQKAMPALKEKLKFTL